MIRVALLLLPLAVFGACSHAPRTTAEPEGPVLPADARARAKAEARVPDLSVARPRDDGSDRGGPEDGPDSDEPGTTMEPGSDAQHGRASFYGAEFVGRRTASGERYDADALTAAHRTLPFGTRVRVTNLQNGRSVEVVINDRGPHRKGRVIDLSRRAAEALDMVSAGTVRVVVEVLDLADSEMR
jgi:rare lipoprotein A